MVAAVTGCFLLESGGTGNGPFLEFGEIRVWIWNLVELGGYGCLMGQ